MAKVVTLTLTLTVEAAFMSFVPVMHAV